MDHPKLTSTLLSIALLSLARGAHADTPGPALELPPEEDMVAAPNAVTIGGYGELHYTANVPEEGPRSNEIDMHRMVLYIGKQFNNRIRFASELEIEHAIAGNGNVGEVSVEQALIDYRFTDEQSGTGIMGIRAGIMLVPMGIVNQWHEPPLFHGVERPTVDKLIIPSTWREGGIGFYHEPTERLSYELYVMGGLNPMKFSSSKGIRGGRQKVGEARTDGLAFAGRAQFEPTGQSVLGVSGYFNRAGKNSDAVDADVSVVGFSADARGKFAGIEAKAEFALFMVGDTNALNAVTDADGVSITDVADTLVGVYGELAYDVFHTMTMTEQLLPFARVEYYDTDPNDDTKSVIDIITGLTFRPIPQVAFKADVVFRRKGGDVQGDNVTLVNLGVGFLY